MFFFHRILSENSSWKVFSPKLYDQNHILFYYFDFESTVLREETFLAWTTVFSFVFLFELVFSSDRNTDNIDHTTYPFTSATKFTEYFISFKMQQKSWIMFMKLKTWNKTQTRWRRGCWLDWNTVDIYPDTMWFYIRLDRLRTQLEAKLLWVVLHMVFLREYQYVGFILCPCLSPSKLYQIKFVIWVVLNPK